MRFGTHRAPAFARPVLLVLAVLVLYGGFLESPFFFDDAGTVDIRNPVYEDWRNAAVLRWLPYASFGWTKDWFGDGMVWLRAGNLLLHAATSVVLYGFLKRLFEPAGPGAAQGGGGGAKAPLAAAWVAFFAALWFALNPVASYGVAYLVQRTILLATLFSLITWWCLLEGLRSKQGGWLVGSVIAYLLAAHAKEHALLVPLVALLVVVLQGRPDRAMLKKLVPTFLLYAVIAAEVYVRVRSGGILGRAYEPNAGAMLASLGVAADGAYPLSVLTQGYLYFKYLLLWLVPNPGWMSVALEEDFATHYLSWPQAIGLLLVPAYLFLAVRTLLKGGRAGLFGFGLLSPALLFLIEFSTVRVQEIFVLYRSYLWMPCLMAVLPYALQRIPGRIAAGALIVVSLVLAAVTVERLRVFAEPVRLWEDAYEKAKETKNRQSLGRILYHRGRAYLHARRFDEAVQAFTIGIALRPGITDFYFSRGAALYETGRYQSALDDFDRMISLEPRHGLSHLGRAKTLEALGQEPAARLSYALSCQFGVAAACRR